MNAIRILSCIFVIAIGLTIHGAPAAAQPATVPCGTAIDGYFSGGSGWLEIVGTRVTARGSFGFSSFTMQDGYSLATTPLNAPAAATQSTFEAWKGAAHYTGPFHEVFAERGNSDVDRSEFWVFRTGELWLRSITWSGVWTQLQGATCSRGPGNQTVVTGYIHNGGSWGTDFWTFLIQGRTVF
jgi:hypothetical protein